MSVIERATAAGVPRVEEPQSQSSSSHPSCPGQRETDTRDRWMDASTRQQESIRIVGTLRGSVPIRGRVAPSAPQSVQHAFVAVSLSCRRGRSGRELVMAHR
jgi:hypothetical protein